MSSSIETRIDTFIQEHNLDPDMKEEIQELCIGCIETMFKHLFSSQLSPEENTKTKKVLKAEKLEDPATAETIEELRNCTTGILNLYCRDKNLKIGGNKKELMDRVWRHIQGDSSDDDKGRGSKAKKEKKIAEKHICSGFKTDGSPCALSGTEDKGDCWFCYKHITDADKFLEAIKKKAQPEGSSSTKKKSKKPEPESEDEDVPAPIIRKSKKKVAVPVEEVEELESEEE